MKHPFMVLMACVLLCACHRDPQVVEPQPPSTDSFGGWQRYTTNLGTNLTDIAFTGEARGFACVESVGLVRSVDSGRTWQTIPSLPSDAQRLTKVLFTDDLHGYSIGLQSFAFTSDGGNNWVYHSFPGSGQDLAFPVPQKGFAASQDGLYSTTDTGATWVRIQPGQWSSIHFTDALNGWAAAQGSGLYHTINGGQTWTLTYQQVPAISDIFFLNASEGWATSADASLLKTVNGGQTWQRIPLIAAAGDLQFLDENLGYATAGKMILKTTNGGVNWQTDCRLSDTELSQLFFLDAGNGWAVGENHTILRWKH